MIGKRECGFSVWSWLSELGHATMAIENGSKRRRFGGGVWLGGVPELMEYRVYYYTS